MAVTGRAIKMVEVIFLGCQTIPATSLGRWWRRWLGSTIMNYTGYEVFSASSKLMDGLFSRAKLSRSFESGRLLWLLLRWMGCVGRESRRGKWAIRLGRLGGGVGVVEARPAVWAKGVRAEDI